jgi:hypothetical protein
LSSTSLCVIPSQKTSPAVWRQWPHPARTLALMAQKRRGVRLCVTAQTCSWLAGFGRVDWRPNRYQFYTFCFTSMCESRLRRQYFQILFNPFSTFPTFPKLFSDLEEMLRSQRYMEQEECCFSVGEVNM